MLKENRKNAYRVIDANLNRAKEGLRVCEDIFRFIFPDKSLCSQFKKIRHSVTEIIDYIPVKRKDLLRWRDADSDIGRRSSKLELKRNGYESLFFANIQRSKESVRVLEEFCKLLNQDKAIKIKTLRYEIYSAEKKAAKRFKALCNS